MIDTWICLVIKFQNVFHIGLGSHFLPCRPTYGSRKMLTLVDRLLNAIQFWTL